LIGHGLLSKEMVVCGLRIKENGREFEKMRQRYWEEMVPVGPMEVSQRC
jgi:hypothetical protein